MTSQIYDSISYDILSETRHHYITSLFIGWRLGFVLLTALTFGLESERKNVIECTRMGITVMKIVIWGCSSLVLWSQIEFYGSVDT